MESYTANDKAIFWVKIADDLSTNPATIYIYYGNPTATTTSNGANTFLFFDDFSGDLSKWTVLAGTWNIVSGELVASATGNNYIRSATFQPSNARVRAKMKLVTYYDYDVLFRLTDINNFYQTRCSNKAGNLYHRVDKCVGGTYTTDIFGNVPFNPGTTYHTETALFSGSHIEAYADDAYRVSGTDTTFSTGYIGLKFYAYTSSDRVYVDWIFASKYVYPEPSHGSWGPETAQVWHNVTSWNLTLLTRTWIPITSWSLTFLARTWTPITSWSLTFLARTWTPISTYNLNLYIPQWNDIAFWILQTKTSLWNNITWTLTLQTLTWKNITFWNLTLLTQEWKQINIYGLTIYIPSWQNIAYWIINTQSRIWNNIASYFFNIQILTWRTITSWFLNFKTAIWNNIVWSLNLKTALWNNIALWLFNIKNAIWNNITSWQITFNTLLSHTIAIWNIITQTLKWNTITLWDAFLKAFSWHTITFWRIITEVLSWKNIVSWTLNIITIGWHNIALWQTILKALTTPHVFIFKNPLIAGIFIMFILGLVIGLIANTRQRKSYKRKF